MSITLTDPPRDLGALALWCLLILAGSFLGSYTYGLMKGFARAMWRKLYKQWRLAHPPFAVGDLVIYDPNVHAVGMDDDRDEEKEPTRLLQVKQIDWSDAHACFTLWCARPGEAEPVVWAGEEYFTLVDHHEPPRLSLVSATHDAADDAHRASVSPLRTLQFKQVLPHLPYWAF